MYRNCSRPRWGWFCLVPALGGASFWLIDQLHAVAVVTDALRIVTVLAVAGAIELWFRLNTLALLLDVGSDRATAPLYSVREAVPARPAAVTTMRRPTSLPAHMGKVPLRVAGSRNGDLMHATHRAAWAGQPLGRRLVARPAAEQHGRP